MAVRFPEGSQISSTEDECRDYLFTHMTAVMTRGKSTEELWKPRAIAIDSNTGEIYVAEGNSRVTIFSETLEFLKTFTHKNMKSPWGIVIHNDSLYMTDILRHSVFYFKVTGASPSVRSFPLINEEGGIGSDTNNYNEPRQLAVFITNGYIYVSDYYNHRIKILDEDLHYIRHISHTSMTTPSDVKLTPDAVYVLSDSDAYCIHVFSHAGGKIQSLIPCGYGPGGQVEYPYFFCLDSRGNFVISDCVLCQIRIFSKEGKLIYKLIHDQWRTSSKFGVAQTANEKLLTVSQDGYRLVNMFSL